MTTEHKCEHLLTELYLSSGNKIRRCNKPAKYKRHDTMLCYHHNKIYGTERESAATQRCRYLLRIETGIITYERAKQYER